MTLLILLAASVAVSLLIGLVARMSVRELLAQTLLMGVTALGMYGLVLLL